MSGPELKKLSRAATVEDWDDDAEEALPNTCTTANVSIRRHPSSDVDCAAPPQTYTHADIDSAYSLTTLADPSMESSRQRATDDKIDTVTSERERQPYQCAARLPPQLQSSTRLEEKKVKPRRFCHQQGICWVCDKYGFHFDPEILNKKKEKTIPVSPPSPTIDRSTASRVKQEESAKPSASRAKSSKHDHYTQPSYMQHPVVPGDWMTAPAPTAIQSVPYGSYYMVSPYHVNAYPAQQTVYFEAPGLLDEPFEPRPVRRASTFGHDKPVIEKKLSRASTVKEQVASYDKRPPVSSHRPSRSIDVDKAMMPPPPRPRAANIATARPQAGRAVTYHPNTVGQRHSQHYEAIDDGEEVLSGEEELLDHRGSMSYRQTLPSASRAPPSSYRRQIQSESSERPVMKQKSRSYTNGSQHVQVAPVSEIRNHAMPRRRTADSVQLEQREANVEAYMRKHGSIPSTDLTVENLKRASRNLDARSEAGSTASHHTHHSSSRGSAVGSGSGRGRGHASASGLEPKSTNMNININGLSLSIANDGSDAGTYQPVTIDLGSVQISMGTRDKENIDFRRDHKRLERAPSTSSNPSRRSLTSNAATTMGMTREQLAIEAAARELSRRSSFVDDERKERDVVRRSNRSSRQASRNPSTTRYDEELRPRTGHRNSVDFAIRK